MIIASFSGVLGITLIIILVLAVIIALWLLGQYNGMIKARNHFKNGFSQIDVQLKRRHELIPNLINTAKGFMKHERDTLEAIIKARQGAEDARSSAAADPSDEAAMSALVTAENGLTGSMGKFFALAESYPDLKSNQNMMQLSEELTSTENKVAFARQAYNDFVTTYNNKREMFPGSVIANMFNFRPATLFEVSDEAERGSVSVEF